MNIPEKLLGPEAPLVEAVRRIEASKRRIVVVADSEGKILGTLTDGDVRRCLLAGGTLETPVTKAMNAKPVTALAGSSDAHLMALMRSANVLSIPLVDDAGRFVRLAHLYELGEGESLPESGFAAAVIMAGGEGLRLRSVVQNIPKPMVDIDGIPLLERQVRRLAQAGIPRCYLSVNYLSHVIEDYFGYGVGFDIEIRYLHEKEKMGTGGSLSLIGDLIDGPLLVMNGDILTTSDFGHFCAYHKEQGAAITVAAVEHDVQIPYGVIRADGAKVAAIEEKPSQRFLCNAGIYALSPDVLGLVPKGFYNMTDLIRDCLESSKQVSVFPIHEFWSDIGTPNDLEKARNLFAKMKETA